jgi:succinyl-CoA:acetate CoA-transferase
MTQTLALLRYMLEHNRSHAEEVKALIPKLTEQGLADLRGLASEERARLIIKNCAHPDFKEPLTDFLEYSLKHAKGVHMPLALSKAFEMHNRYLETGKMLP